MNVEPAAPRPTFMRYGILAMAVVVAVLLYLDRFCLSTADRAIKADLELTEAQVAALLGAFFLPYALGQIPFGWMADRWGPRRMLTLYMMAWSICTALLGAARGFADFYLYRLGCGLFEAGGYPACAGIIKRWIPVSQRGLASGIVSIGGRLGGAITPALTATSMAFFAVTLPDVFSWRPTFLVFGVVSFVIAILFWVIHRDRPEQHPLCNQAEVDLIHGGAPPPERTKKFVFPFREMVGNRSLWLSSFVQFGSNFGWAFLLTYLNRYLAEERGVDDLSLRGRMSSMVMLFSLPSLILGGLLTDWLTRRFGTRLGRMIPLTAPRFVAAGLYASVPILSVFMGPPSIANTWIIIIVFGLIAFFNDLTLSAIWAFNMDIGGRNVGLVLGWGNMWGNMGAWLSPLAVNFLVSGWGWNAVFFTCGAAFGIIALASLFIDARETLPDE